MKRIKFLVAIIVMAHCSACSIFEKSSRHGFESGYYVYKDKNGEKSNVFLDVGEANISGYSITGKKLDKSPVLEISLESGDTLDEHPENFIKHSIDIDITTILFKYRPGVQELPAQLLTDFNAAMFAGWRRDNYHLKTFAHPFRHDHYEVVTRGFDIGVFAGVGTTAVNSFSTQETVVNEYNGMILQYGIAGFIESNVASFGLSTGYDYLMGEDRKYWIYNRKPWIGFIVGIALN